MSLFEKCGDIQHGLTLFMSSASSFKNPERLRLVSQGHAHLFRDSLVLLIELEGLEVSSEGLVSLCC
ncbi:hypothetical protein FGO68_gene12473 [Halteria grandinella]|uniref:Uncharacterized protein n=1 Tax=Halteria grandinella TaxID=5974 RepID=A0A8J8NG23_HALGN|nr:hypothetical protein FGO68_gene12473 [Halteria grandinella]